MEFSAHYHYHKNDAKEVGLVKLGRCPVEGHGDVVVDTFGMFGNINSHKECYRCVEIYNNSISKLVDEPDNIWILCGSSGCGKSSIFNTLTGQNRLVSSGVTSSTNCETMQEDVFSPKRCTINGLQNICLCDTEGIGATSTAVGEQGKGNGQQDLDKFATGLKMVYARALSGVSGLILCVEVEQKFTMVHQLYMKSLVEMIGDVPIIICVTKYEKMTMEDDYATLSEKKNESCNWLNREKDNMLKLLQLKAIVVNFVVISARKKDLSDLIFYMRASICATPKIESIRNDKNIPVATVIQPEHYHIINNASTEMAIEVVKKDWFEETLTLLFDNPFGIIGSVVILPFAILGGVGVGLNGMASWALGNSK